MSTKTIDILLDNSALSLLHCKRKFQLTVLHGYVPTANAAADFGSAYHKAIELIDKNLPPEEVVNKVFEQHPAADKLKLLKILTLFKSSYTIPTPVLLGNIPAIEYKFKFFYKTIRISDLIINFHLCGTLDNLHIDTKTKLGNEPQEQLVFLDYKTSGAGSEYLIEKTIKEYTTSFQLPFYVFALLNSGILNAAQLDYIHSGRYRTEMLIAFYNSPGAPFKRLIRPAFNYTFLNHIVRDLINDRIREIAEMIVMYPDVLTPAPYTGFNTYQGCLNCTYRPACLVAGSDRETYILANNYDVKPYDPMSFR